MADYDISKAFKVIEDDLIGSMIRNLDHHRAKETDEGIQWTQWQVQQLKMLERYKQTNAKKFGKQFNSINNQIANVLTQMQEKGGFDQEQYILKAIQNGFKGYKHLADGSIQGEFFGINDNKLQALINATTNDMKKAETAVLRLADDQYRKAIFNAQIYAQTGGTYAKAVDMATKDMLRAGLNCVEYKNGARHTLSSYAEMALRTAGTRAYLQGEGEKRKEWGIHTVILNQRTCPCPLCFPFVGKVFVDDVWSGGTQEEAQELGYPLLSEAIAEGLYHPNCKDIHTTYFEGITSKNKPTASEKQRAIEEHIQQQKANYSQNQAYKYHRMSTYSLDEDNKRIYKARATEWEEKADSFKIYYVANSVHKIADTLDNNSKSDIIKCSYSKEVKKEVKEAFDNEYASMVDKFGTISTIRSLEALKSGTAYGEYYDYSGVLAIRFANKKDCLKQLAQKAVEMKKNGKWSSAHPMHIIRHEIGHAIQAEHAKNDPLWKSKLSKILVIMGSVDKTAVSEYSMADINEFISECIAESMTKKARKTSKDVVDIILGG